MRWRVARGIALGVALALLAGCSLVRRDRPAAELRARKLMVPVAGVAPAEIADTFYASRGGGTRRHHALDIFAPHGTPVLAADDGFVLGVRESRLGGKSVYATDPRRRFVYYYAHLSSYHPDTVPGRRVRRGDVLGYVGSTGNADARAPHLHFQVRAHPPDERWWTGTPINPYGTFASPGRRVRR
jgi:murein DD-endopeptidase MepM/ murein hydrolase activator NlpD